MIATNDRCRHAAAHFGKSNRCHSSQWAAIVASRWSFGYGHMVGYKSCRYGFHAINAKQGEVHYSVFLVVTCTVSCTADICNTHPPVYHYTLQLISGKIYSPNYPHRIGRSRCKVIHYCYNTLCCLNHSACIVYFIAVKVCIFSIRKIPMGNMNAEDKKRMRYAYQV